MKRFALIALWLVATAATTVVAYVAVQAADAEVTDRPLSTVVTSSSTTGTSATTSTDATGGVASTTTSVATTTGPTSTSSTTAASEEWTQTTVATSGGLVVLSYRPGEVRLAAVVPHPGFAYEVDEEGPPEVKVEFESDDVKIEIRAEWDGGLVTEVNEDG